MKEKIKERLKAKLKDSGVNLSNKRMDAIADRLSTKITKEEDIDGKLDELNELQPFSEIAKFDDYERAKEAKEKEDREKKEKESKDKKDPKDKKDLEEDDEKPPKWAQSLIDKVNSFEQKEKSQTIKEKLEAKLKEKKIPLVFAKGRMVEKEEDIDGLITEIETDWTELEQSRADEGLSKFPVPGGGNNKPSPKAVDDDIKSWAEKEKARTKVVTATTSKN